MRVILLLSFLVYVCAEPPAAPYAPSGWKPSKPFNLPNEQPKPEQNYGPPKQEYGPPNQEYGPPKQEYGPPTKQELPKPEEPKPWQEYGPPPTVQPSISWQIPDDSARLLPEPKQEYGPPQEEITPTTEEQPLESSTDANEDEETQRVLEQIRQYRIKASRQQKLRLRNQLGRLRANLQAAPRTPQRTQRLQKQRVNNKQFNRFRSERLQEEPQVLNEEEIQQNGQTNGYDYSGYKPSQGYLPSNTYDPPVTFTTEQPLTPSTLPEITTLPDISESTTEFVLTSEEPQVEENPEEEEGNIAVSTAVANQEQKGQYYILQPNGKLQRISYRTLPNPKNRNSPIVSNLRYETVKPIQDPIYSYNNGKLVRIN